VNLGRRASRNETILQSISVVFSFLQDCYRGLTCRNGWQGFDAPGVQPYWTGKDAKEDAINYATARAKFGRGKIRVLDGNGSIKDVIRLEGVSEIYD